MPASVQLPESLAQRLEKLAEEEGTSLDGLIRLLLSEHSARTRQKAALREEIRLPLIRIEETGVILPVTGGGLDEMFAIDDFPS